MLPDVYNANFGQLFKMHYNHFNTEIKKNSISTRVWVPLTPNSYLYAVNNNHAAFDHVT